MMGQTDVHSGIPQANRPTLLERHTDIHLGIHADT